MTSLAQDPKLSQLGAAMRDELTRCEDGELANSRAMALRYYSGDLPAAPGGGRSGVVSQDVADSVNAITAQLMPMISTDAVVEFEADGPEDEDGASAESAAVNRVILEDNAGLVELEEALRDALLLRSGVVKIWPDERTEREKIAFDIIPDDQLKMLMASTPPGEVRTLTARDGQSAEVTIDRTDVRFRFEAVDPSNLMLRQGWTGGDLEDCPFTAERRYVTRSQLVDEGFPRDLVDMLPAVDAPRSAESYYRGPELQRDMEAVQKAGETVECHECFAHYDWDDDGVAELRRVYLAGDAFVLEHEEVELVPYAVGSVIVRSHRVVGESVFDRLRQVQDAKTQALRQWIDNLVMGNNQRTIMNDAETNLADAIDSKPGGVVRSRNPQNVIPFPFVDTGGSSQGLLGYMDEMRSEAVGAALDLQNGMAQLQNVAASAIERQYTSKELVVSLMARNFSETLIRRAWRLMHETLRRWSNKPIQLRLAGQWQAVDPSSWPQRTKLNVRTGMSIGARSHAQATLQAAMQFQQQAMQLGREGQLADNVTLYRTYLDWLTMAGLDAPDRYALDPRSPEAAQAAQMMAQAQQQQMMQQAKLQEGVLGIERDKNNVAMLKMRADAAKNEDDIAFKYWDARLKAELEEAKLVGQASLDLERITMEGEQREREGRREAAAGAAAAGGADQR